MDAATLRRFIAALGPDMVLVGGQALSFWMYRYDLAPADASITNDGDALGSRRDAEALARSLGGKLLVPPARARTSIVAQVRLPRTDGTTVNIDVLHLLYSTGGLKKSNEFTRGVLQRSVQVETTDGVSFRVMDPLDVLDSRVQNAAGLLSAKGPHVLTQARWAVRVASAVLSHLAVSGRTQETATKRLGAALARIYRLAHSSAGRSLWRDHGIDILSAIQVDTLAALSPAHGLQLAKVREAQAARRTASPA